MSTQLADPAITVMFHLAIENLSAGWWNSFEGLGMETSIEQREVGGNNLWIYQFPTRLKFTNVKLSRPLNEDSQNIAALFMDVVQKVERRTASIKAVDATKKVIAEWTLLGVVPVRWTGPSFNVESPKPATETLELAYHGFRRPAAQTGGMA